MSMPQPSHNDPLPACEYGGRCEPGHCPGPCGNGGENPPTLTVGSLCTGAGGLDLAAADALGATRTVWVAENDPDASTVLRWRFGVPNLGDIAAVDWSTVEPVDVVTAGFPCQDISNAGQRAGIEGEKSGVWRHVATAIGVLRPRLVCVENVSALLVRGGTRVVADLAALGYVGSWRTLRASDVGAPHRRERVFLVAADPDREPVRIEPQPVGARHDATVAGGDRPGPDGLAVWRQTTSRRGKPGEELIRAPRTLMPTPTDRGSAGRGLPGADLAERRYASGRRMLDDAVAMLPTPTSRVATRGRGGPGDYDPAGRPLSEAVALLPTPWASEGAKGGPNQRGSAGDLTLTSSVMLLPTPTVKDSAGGPRVIQPRTHDGTDFGPCLRDVAHHHADRWAQYGPAIARWEAVLGRPAPEPTVVGKRGGRRLSGRFVEWLMGWPDGWATDLVDNTAALRLCGNGVVRQQGAAALTLLGAR